KNTADIDLEAALKDRVWSFGREGDSRPIAEAIELRPGGNIGGYRNPNEHQWRIHDGAVEFLNTDGIATTRFFPVSSPPGAPLTLRGGFLGKPPGIVHVLAEKWKK